jgi:DNA gyrase/topoisomerase IV subunit A
MDKQEIQQKAAELQKIMADYKSDLGSLEQELRKAVEMYLAALREAKLNEIKKGIMGA